MARAIVESTPTQALYDITNTKYDPSGGSTNHRSPNPADPNTFDLGHLKFEALGDRLIILEDEFKTGYECSKCNGHGKIGCYECSAQGTKPNGKKCSSCEGSGHVVCDQCGGKGGLIIAPETAQRRPTTGRIVSAGDRVQHLRVDQNVMYSNFSGYVVDLERAGQPICLRIVHETEVLCRIEGHLTLSNLKGKSDIALAAS